MFDSRCVREKANLAKPDSVYKLDKDSFNPELLLENLKTISPKAIELMNKIAELDKKDLKESGKLYKHFIFCDVKSKIYGIQFLASCFVSYGYNLGYNSKHNLTSEKDLLKTKNNNFYLLTSLDIFNKPLKVITKKNILKNFNDRPGNVHGKYTRFILMDAGFKEGVDLFDIKYIHIFEPAVNEADMKQVIGRGTRTCGQKGLRFIPDVGWPLHVFIYDLLIPECISSKLMDSSSLFEVYLKTLNINIKEKFFASDLQKVTIENSVDYDLNKNIHEFRAGKQGGGSRSEIIKKPKSICYNLKQSECNDNPECLYAKGTLRQYCRKKKRKRTKRKYVKKVKPIIKSYTSSSPQPSSLELQPLVPTDKMSQERLREFIKENFSNYKWDKVTIENMCGEDMIPQNEFESQNDYESQHGGSNVITYTPTQSFISNYFTPDNFAKGMLLWHSVGTGKTCSAIATATKNFESQGYTILWVTRTTLKNDIWKNMFDQICNENIRQMILSGKAIPADHIKRMHMLSKSWSIRPLSYKQFTNLISQSNQFYDDLVKINGPQDILRKTLLIIDEAHKLYGGGDLSGMERPDMKLLKKIIMDSYIKSGKDSVRLMLMTATPITENPMELIQLLNLCKLPDEQMPETFLEFSQTYLNEEGSFTKSGETKYANEIAGLVSYLNREFDVRQFAQPKISFITTPISSSEEIKNVNSFIYEKSHEKTKTKKRNKLLNMKVFKKNTITLSKFRSSCDLFKKDKEKFKECKKIVKSSIDQLLIDIDLYKNMLVEKFKLTDSKLSLPVDPKYKLSIYYNLLLKCQKALKNQESPEIVSLLENKKQIKEFIKTMMIEINTLKKIKLQTHEQKEMIQKLKKDIILKNNYIKIIEEEIIAIKKEQSEIIKEKKKLEKLENESFTQKEEDEISHQVNILIDKSIKELEYKLMKLS
jgi:superfamily II DNA or RNA helicase